MFATMMRASCPSHEPAQRVLDPGRPACASVQSGWFSRAQAAYQPGDRVDAQRKLWEPSKGGRAASRKEQGHRYGSDAGARDTNGPHPASSTRKVNGSTAMP